MADYAMSFDRLGFWIGERAKSARLRHPQATSLSMLDGAAAVVAGPVSMVPEEWICPLLASNIENHDSRRLDLHMVCCRAASTDREGYYDDGRGHLRDGVSKLAPLIRLCYRSDRRQIGGEGAEFYCVLNN